MLSQANNHIGIYFTKRLNGRKQKKQEKNASGKCMNGFLSSMWLSLIPKKVKSEAQTKLVLTCKKCSYKNKESTGKEKLKVKTITHCPKPMLAIIDKEQELNVEPTMQITCEKCGNTKAYVWQVQTRGANESSTQFLRCTSCGHTFREYT
jgi:transcription factor S